VWRSSRGVQSRPRPAFSVIRLKSIRTSVAYMGPPRLVQNTRLFSLGCVQHGKSLTIAFWIAWIRIILVSLTLLADRRFGQRGARSIPFYWFDGSTAAPTVRAVVEHARLMLDADLSFPVILGPDGRVMDGMHRIARAMLEGKTEVSAVRFLALPEPDYRDRQPADLPY
jgi:hypothetical protein